MFRQFFNRINNISLLGRWEHRLTDKQKELKLRYNNLDHFGDKICGDLLKYKNFKQQGINKDHKFKN